MKTYSIKSFLIFLLLGFALASCSKDDNSDSTDKNEDLKTGHATAAIEVDTKTIQFSTKTDKSFATITKTQIGNNEMDELTIIMMDDNSKVMIVAQAVPSPGQPIVYDLSKPLSQDYFFTTIVAIKGKNSSDQNVYGVGSYQHGEEVVIQSKGAFKITSMTSTTIKGTFEMTLYNTYDPNNAQDAEKLTVTEGKFDLPIVELDEEDLEDLGLD